MKKRFYLQILTADHISEKLHHTKKIIMVFPSTSSSQNILLGIKSTFNSSHLRIHFEIIKFYGILSKNLQFISFTHTWQTRLQQIVDIFVLGMRHCENRPVRAKHAPISCEDLQNMLKLSKRTKSHQYSYRISLVIRQTFFIPKQSQKSRSIL